MVGRARPPPANPIKNRMAIVSWDWKMLVNLLNVLRYAPEDGATLIQ